MNRLLLDLLIAIALIVAIVWASAVLIGAAHAQEPWQLGCKIRTGIGAASLVVGCLTAGSILGLVACGLLRTGCGR
jgi:hypothetical protein